MHYFLQAFKKIFTYQGRARRAEYGWFMLINLLLQLGVGLTALVLLGGGKMLFATNTPEIFIHGVGVTALLLNLGLLIYGLLNFFVMLSLTARRLHDIGLSGWWQLVVFVAPLVVLGSVFIALPIIEHSPLNPVWVVESVTWLVVIGVIGFQLMLLFKDGQKHPNQYGESPKYPSRPI